MNWVCTSGRKHETLCIGGFEYADFKNHGNHAVTPTVLAQKRKIQNGRRKPFFAHNLLIISSNLMIYGSFSMFSQSRILLEYIENM